MPPSLPIRWIPKTEMTEADKILYRESLKHPDVEEPIDLWFYRPVGFRVALLGRRLHWTPNQITIASIFLGIGCGILCYPQDLGLNLLAIVLLILADIGDSADGQLARLTRQYSQLGRILETIACPILMFVSDGKQVSAGWIEHEREFAEQTNARIIYLNCGHYIHYYESERISREIRIFVKDTE